MPSGNRVNAVEPDLSGAVSAYSRQPSYFVACRCSAELDSTPTSSRYAGTAHTTRCFDGYISCPSYPGLSAYHQQTARSRECPHVVRSLRYGCSYVDSSSICKSARQARFRTLTMGLYMQCKRRRKSEPWLFPSVRYVLSIISFSRDVVAWIADRYCSTWEVSLLVSSQAPGPHRGCS